jgi:fluoroacetyl-CoA thioesterase
VTLDKGYAHGWPISELAGAEAAVEEMVTVEMTARRVGSGDVSVLATPSLLALIERAAVAAVAGRLPPGQTTVGASVDLAHLAPTPVGASVAAIARVDRVNGRRLVFAVSVTDVAGEVARGRHVRVVVDRGRFEASAASRTEPLC